MKVTVKEKDESADIKYPCLMITDTKEIVLFYLHEIGTVIKSRDESVWNIGEYCSSWCMSDLKPFNGTVTLSNEE